VGVFNVSLGNYTRVPGSPPLCTPEGPELSDEQIMEQLFGGAIVRIIDLPPASSVEDPLVDDSQPRETLDEEFGGALASEEEIAEDHIVTLDPYV
jgi:hypothetical protein